MVVLQLEHVVILQGGSSGSRIGGSGGGGGGNCGRIRSIGIRSGSGGRSSCLLSFRGRDLQLLLRAAALLCALLAADEGCAGGIFCHLDAR